MADLNYGDIQRAVNEAMSQLRGPIDELRGKVNEISRDTSEIEKNRLQLDELTRRLASLERMIAQLGQQIQYTHQMATDTHRSSQLNVGVSQQVSQLHGRFQAVERFASEVSTYLQHIRRQDEEDQGYRRATG